MNAEKVLEVLKRVEWSRGCSGMGTYCPWCHSWRSEGREAKAVGVTEAGAVPVADLWKLLDLLGVPEDAGLYICDPADPARRFIIREVD